MLPKKWKLNSFGKYYQMKWYYQMKKVHSMSINGYEPFLILQN